MRLVVFFTINESAIVVYPSDELHVARGLCYNWNMNEAGDWGYESKRTTNTGVNENRGIRLR